MKKISSNLIINIFLPFFSLVFVFCIFVFFLTPKFGEILKVKKEIQDQQKQIDGLTAKLNDLKSLSIPELTNSTSLLLGTLPENKDFYRVLSGIKGVFSSEGIIILSYQFNPGLVSSDSSKNVDNSSGNSMTIKVSFQTTFDKLKGLISKLEKSLPIVTVDSIKYNGETASISGSLSSVDIVVKSYYSPLPRVLGAVDKPLPKITSAKSDLIEKLKLYTDYFVTENFNQGEVVVGKDNPFPSQ